MGGLKCSGDCLLERMHAYDLGTLVTPFGPDLLLLESPIVESPIDPPAPRPRTLEE